MTSQQRDDHDNPMCLSGVIPRLALRAGLGPPRSECGVGALMGWADRLWAVSYVSHKKESGVGTGLYEIDEGFRLTHRPESRVGTYTNRFVHYPSSQLIIGPHLIDPLRKVRTVEALADVRLCSTMRHLEDPDNKVYMLGMEGELFEMDVHTLAVRQLFDLTQELRSPRPRYIHLKAGHSALGKVLVAGNDYQEADFLGEVAGGRLAEWDGKKWTILEERPFVEVTGRGDFPSRTIFATGWDRASAILKVYTDADKAWTTYRLPKASHTYDHIWQTEWPRIRETEHERFLMDCHGMFYQLSPWAYGGRVWGVLPICRHLWVLGDFCSWRGMLVMGADNASPSGPDNHLTAEPVSGLWFGKTDDLWSFGKPAGWGGPWWKTPVRAGEPSDPYLMTGFDKKCLHLAVEEDSTRRGRSARTAGGPASRRGTSARRAGRSLGFTVEVDFLGDGSWRSYESFRLGPGGYVHHEFPRGFSAHWLRVATDADCTATAQLFYT